jgi:transposase
MVPKKRKSYTREYKIETVKLVTEGGASASQVADEMGIHVNTLYKWIRDLSAKPEEAFPGKGHMTCSDAETIRQLKRENERLRMEREILKKAMAIFSKDPS